MTRKLIWTFLFLCTLTTQDVGAEKPFEVDLELVLLADASGSIDQAEIRFQRRGYASAIMHPQVLATIAKGALKRIAITYMEWATIALRRSSFPGPSSTA